MWMMSNRSCYEIVSPTCQGRGKVFYVGGAVGGGGGGGVKHTSISAYKYYAK